MMRSSLLDPRRHRRTWLACLLGSGLLLALLPGCAKDPSSPSAARPSNPPTGDQLDLPIDGGQLPSIIDEGAPFTFTVWGTTPDTTWVLDRMQVEVVALPGEQPGSIVITALGRAYDAAGNPAGGTWPDSSGADSTRLGRSYRGTVTLPPLPRGEYTVVLHAPGNDRQFTLRVRSTGEWIVYRRQDAARPDSMPGPLPSATVSLTLTREGLATVCREGSGVAAAVQIPADSLAVIAGWFREAGFEQLQDTYLSQDPWTVPTVQISLRADSTAKSVLAEVALMPPALSLLAERLDRLAASILVPLPPVPTVWGDLEVDPLAADPGTARTIRLRLHNVGSTVATLNFTSTQWYDFVLTDTGNPATGVPGDSLSGDPTQGMIWNWAYHHAFPQVLTSLALQPGETRTFEESWSGLGNLGETVGPGNFVLYGWVPSDLPVSVAPARVVVNGEILTGPPLAAVAACIPLEGPPGTPRTFTLLVTNLHDRPVEIGFATAQRYDFMITGPWAKRLAGDPVQGRLFDDGTPGTPPDSLPPVFPPSGPVWTWSNGQTFPEQPGVETFAPGEQRVYTVTWDGRAAGSGEVVGPGAYDLLGGLTGRPLIQGRPASFVVTRP